MINATYVFMKMTHDLIIVTENKQELQERWRSGKGVQEAWPDDEPGEDIIDVD